MEQTTKAVYLTSSLPVTTDSLTVAQTPTTSNTIQINKVSEDCAIKSEPEQDTKPGSSTSTNHSTDNLNKANNVEDDSLDEGNDEEDDSEYEMNDCCDSDDPMEFGNFEVNESTTSGNGHSNQSDASGANTEQAKMELFWRLMDMGFSRGM